MSVKNTIIKEWDYQSIANFKQPENWASQLTSPCVSSYFCIIIFVSNLTFVSNRVQCVKLNNIISASLPVTSGVPQGSILGPLLFLVFINDLPTQVSHSKTFLYADDLKLIHNNLLEMQNDILPLSQWSQVNKLSFNAKKTQLISFDFRSQNYITDIPVPILDDHEIFLQKSVADLGLSFSSNLAWSKHISDRLKACYIGIISLRRCLPPHLHS